MGETHQHRNFRQENHFHIYLILLLLQNNFFFISWILVVVYLQQHLSVHNSTIPHLKSGLVIHIPEATALLTILESKWDTQCHYAL